FFQAEDGIRDFHVTGVQTCALPISSGQGAGSLPITPVVRLGGNGGAEPDSIRQGEAVDDLLQLLGGDGLNGLVELSGAHREHPFVSLPQCNGTGSLSQGTGSTLRQRCC